MQHIRPKAFTLIELLVVIAIIALLVSILLPSLQRAKEIAQLVRCQSHLHGLAQAHAIYAADHDGYIPGEDGVALHRNGLPPRFQGDKYNQPWHNMPTETGFLHQEKAQTDPEMWLCPADRRTLGTFTYSFTLNGRTGALPEDDGKMQPRRVDGRNGFRILPRRMDTFPNASDWILLGEEHTGALKGKGSNFGILINDPRFTNRDRSEPRHLDDSSGVSYLDGHAGTIPGDVELFYDPEYWAVPLDD